MEHVDRANYAELTGHSEQAEAVEPTMDPSGSGQATGAGGLFSSLSVRSRVIPAVTIVVVVSLLGLLGYSLYQTREKGVDTSGGINTAGQLITFSNRKAPNFTVKTFDGKTMSLNQFRGKTVLLNFWQSTCVPCQQESPVLDQFQQAMNPNQVVLLGINVWDLQSDAAKYLQQYSVTYPNGIDSDGSTAIDYGVAGVPETFIISPSGMMLGKFPGAFSSVGQINGYIASLEQSSGR